jgi:hypothetical protein
VSSFAAEHAVEDARKHGKALLKFISANDVGLTGGHQYGFYLPKAVWQWFAPFGPEKGRVDKADVEVTWPDGLVTHSAVTWYGKETRSEYRLTRFGRGFPWLSHDLVGALLVLIPKSVDEFIAYVLESEEDIENVQAALDVYVVERWAFYLADAQVEESADACVNRLCHAFAEVVKVFPATREISLKAREIVFACISGIAQKGSDEQLLEFVRNELVLFRMIERKLFEGEVRRQFETIEDFIATALSILNARKSRAGRALENHVEFLLREAELPFDVRARVEGTTPDILLPGKKAYDDAARGRYPREKLIMVGLKTTCKDRWRQVLNEAPQIPTKHILTLQEGISPRQLEEMHRSNVVLVVPQGLHGRYPAEREITLLAVEEFIARAREILS